MKLVLALVFCVAAVTAEVYFKDDFTDGEIVWCSFKL